MYLDTKKLEIELAKKAMNTADLAKKTGYSLTTIRDYANGKRNPTTKSIGIIANALSVNVLELIRFEND